MKFIKYSDLNRKEKNLVNKAFKAAKRSISEKGHQVGCAILCKNGSVFLGATSERSHAIGSTCAERMAVDQLYFHGNKQPKVCVLVGLFKRKGWSQNLVCTPCGVCLEMFRELITNLKLDDLPFICPSWNKKRILKASLNELFPNSNKGNQTKI